MQSRLLSATTRKYGDVENKDGSKARCPVALVESGETVSDVSAKVEFGRSKPSAQSRVTTGVREGGPIWQCIGDR